MQAWLVDLLALTGILIQIVEEQTVHNRSQGVSRAGANGSITITSLASLSVMRSDSFTGAHGEYAVEYLETLCVLHPCLCHFMRHGAVYIRAVPLQLSHAQWHGADMCSLRLTCT